MDKSLRTFIAVGLDKEVQDTLNQIQSDLDKLDIDAKWVKPENIHITLRFLGNVSPKKLKSIIESLPQWLEGCSPFEINITHLGAFPKIQRPRVILAKINKKSEHVLKVFERVEVGLCRLGFRKEERAFSPHITIGRLRSPKNQALISQAISEYVIPTGCVQSVEKVILFKSTLTSQGPIYESLKSVELKFYPSL